MLQEIIQVLRGERGDGDTLIGIVVVVLFVVAAILACTALPPWPPQ